MRQYTTPEQTAKLIELGFENPNVRVDTMISTLNGIRQEPLTIINDFSIGELIEMLPRTIKLYYDLNIFCTTQGWWVLYGMIGDGDMWSVEYELYRKELIDALFDMIVKLKEEMVI